MRLSTTRKTTGVTAAFFTLALIVFACVFPYNANINNPNENVRVYMTMAIVDFHTFRIDKVVERQGWVNDMARAPDPKVPGEAHYYSVKGPATGYFGVPFYWVLTKIAPHFGHPVPTVESPIPERVWWMRASTFVIRFFVVQVPCFLFLIWFERWLRKTSDDTILRLIAVAAVAFGTNYIAYSLMFVSHSLFAVAAFGSFGVITSERLRYRNPRERRVSRALLAGFLAGLASLLEYHAFPISCALFVYSLTTFWRPTRLVSFGAGALVCAGALMFYQWRCYDNPLTPGHKLAESPQFSAWHKQGFFGLGAPSWEVFKDLSISHAFGFFGLSPFMWLGLFAILFGGIFFSYGTRHERRVRRAATIAWLLMMAALWVAISCAVNWRGGWTVGPRFFGAAPPFFAFGALAALEWLARRRGRAWRPIARGIAAGLMLAGVASIGFVSLVFNSIPEDVTRPLVQLALPLARAGFVPHHVMELFGKTSIVFFWIVAGCMFAAALLAAFWPSGEKRTARLRLGRSVVEIRYWTYPLRFVLVLAFAFIGIRPAFSTPDIEEIGDGVGAHRWLATVWEPPGRDRIATLREEAERFGPRKPCIWYKLADTERLVDWVAEAERDEKRAGATPREACR
jgi:hypothetical protein